MRRFEWIVMGLLVLGAVSFWLLPRREEPPEFKRLEAETDRVLSEIGRVTGGIRGPNRKKLEQLLEELDGLYQETMRLARTAEKKVETEGGKRTQEDLHAFSGLAARQRAILLPFWHLQVKEQQRPK